MAGGRAQGGAAENGSMEEKAVEDRTVEGRAGEKRAGENRARLVPGRQQAGGAAKGQMRKGRSDSWTLETEHIFFATLAQTCNASEAAREAGVCRASAYRRKASDPVFAEHWEDALAEGYGEIELMLMRAALFGHESEETVRDGEGVVKTHKVTRKQDMGVAMRLLLTHRDTVAAIRKDRMDRATAGVTEDDGAVRQRVHAALDVAHARLRGGG